MNGLAVVTVGSFATEQNFMTCGMVGSLERNIQFDGKRQIASTYTAPPRALNSSL